ncbi:hypothetical protein K474DRAFT_1776334 [Panus rudis PR-1116 ss-1]|nr:hypothetical protein K474DRAFT_1776334 [Panus rudis PR-1116 ss-1]
MMVVSTKFPSSPKLRSLHLTRESSTSTVVLLSHHPEYYFEDGNLVILVENILFRVFRSTFTRHSSTFSDLFDLPQPSDNELLIEGASDANPVTLSGVSATDFERLLWILYPPTYGVCKAQTLDEWTSILELATKWDFASIRALAIRSIQSLDISPVDRIAISTKYDIADRWTMKAYIALCERPEPLSLAEADQLGLNTVVRIAQIREQLRRSGTSAGYNSLTRSAAGRRAEQQGTSWQRPNASERHRWDIGRSFLDQGGIPPPVKRRQTPVVSRPVRSAPSRSARLVAEAFGFPSST